MAHKSKKKHLKHVHQQEPAGAAPRPTRHAGAKTDIEAARIARPRGTKASTKRAAPKTKAAPKKRGLVRSLASAATQKITAKPRRIISRATSKVKSLLGRK